MEAVRERLHPASNLFERLRWYQKEAVSMLSKGFQQHKRQLLVHPTGAGKTVVFITIALMAKHKGNKTLIITDRIELFKQTYNALADHADGGIQIIKAGTNGVQDKGITIAMVESLFKRLKKNELRSMINPDLIIIDEAHKKTFNKILKLYPETPAIGATATPIGSHLYQFYTNIIDNVDVPDLIADGYLLPYRAIQIVSEGDDKMEVKAGEFTKASQFKFFNNRKIYRGVVKYYKEKTPGTKALVFCVNIEHTINTHKEFLDAGISAECIHSKTPDWIRNDILARYHRGDFPVLINCGILTEGYDYPPIETVVINRATMSLSLFLQMMGRGSRPSSDTGKEFFTVLDFGGNHDRHGLWDMDRKWELKPPKKRKKGTQPIKTCPKCESLLPAQVMVCKFCGFKFPKKDNTADGIAQEVQKVPAEIAGKRISKLSLEDLLLLEKTKKFKPAFIWRVVRTKGDTFLAEYASRKGYKSGWVRKQNELSTGFKDFILY